MKYQPKKLGIGPEDTFRAIHDYTYYNGGRAVTMAHEARHGPFKVKKFQAGFIIAEDVFGTSREFSLTVWTFIKVLTKRRC